MVQLSHIYITTGKTIALTIQTLQDNGGGHGNPANTIAWRIPVDRGAWWATVMGSQRVHGVAKSQTWAFFMVQLSHPHMATGKTIVLTYTDLY